MAPSSSHVKRSLLASSASFLLKAGQVTKSLSEPPRGYLTPRWATLALLPHIQHLVTVLEPAAGRGGIVRVLKENGIKVEPFDVYTYQDEEITVNRRNFFSQRWDSKYSKLRMNIKAGDGGIICSPPLHLIDRFIKKALSMTEHHGTVAMWLPNSIDTQYRYHEFFCCPAFYKKVIPVRRLALGNDETELKSWFIWRHGYGGDPHVFYEIILVA